MTQTTTWVVLFSDAGDCEASEVYSTADSAAEAREMCSRLMAEVPGSYAECLTWDDAAGMGLVS